jgi:recombination protein RecT
MATQTTAITKSPVMEAINSAKAQFEGRLPKGMTVERFMFGLSTVVQKNPDLLMCDKSSLLLAAYEAAELGINLSPTLQYGYIIPFRVKDDDGKVVKINAQFQIGYRGMVQKSYETKAFKAFFAEVVYANDKFTRTLAPKRILNHTPADGDRGKPIGAYALVEVGDFIPEHFDYEYLTEEQIQRHRSCSKAPNSLMHTKFWEEAWRKSAIRVLFKRLPMAAPGMEELAEIIERDAANDFEPEPTGKLVLETDSTLHELKKAPTPVPSPAPIFVYVDKEFTIISGNFRPIETDLPKVGAKWDGVSRVWTMPAARTHELLSLCDAKGQKYAEVDGDGKMILADTTAT